MNNSIREHIRILGILNLIFGGFNILAALIVFLVLGGISGMLGIVGVAEDPEAAVAAGMVGLLAVLIGGIIVVSTLPALLVGWGLLKRFSWARIVAIIFAIFNLFSFPLGTALSIYTMVILFDERAAAEFGNQTQPAPIRAA